MLIAVGPVLGSLFALVIIPSGSADQVPATPAEPALLSVTATVRNFDASAGQATALLVPGAPDDSDADDPLFDGAVLAEERRWTGIGWAVFFVVLCWMLAISAASATSVAHRRI